MPPPQVRADHEALKQIAADFGEQASAAQQALALLQRQAEALRSGGWVGSGAKAFHQEMSDAVLPALRRLVHALASARQTTAQISRVFEQAEADAARVLRGEAGAAQAAGSQGRASIFGTPILTGPAFLPTLRPPNPRAVRRAIERRRAAAQDAAVDKMLSIFDPKVRDLAKRSPTLRAQMLALQKKGIMFMTGPQSQTIERFVTIQKEVTGADAVAMIAHEAGHVMTRDQQIGRIEATPSMTRNEYVDLNVANNLRKEAMAQFNALQVRAELLAAGAEDIGVPGDEDAGFQQVYADYAAGRITRDQAVDRMGPVMGNVVREAGPPPKTYRDFAVDFYRNDWDTHIAPARRP